MVSPGEVAAIVVESWLGEGGYVLPPEGWFRYLRELCDRHGILLVCDEVQSGMGRSGTMWAIEQEGVQPDIITAGKGIASGLPLGAMIARDEVMSWEPGAHGSTLRRLAGAVCQAALATLDVIEEEGLMANASRMGEPLPRGSAPGRDASPDHHRRPRPCGPVDSGLSFGDHGSWRRPSSRPASTVGCSPGVARRRDPHLAAARVPRGPGAGALGGFEEAVARSTAAGS
jgi:4-aminobutyrate aminotransferase